MAPRHKESLSGQRCQLSLPNRVPISFGNLCHDRKFGQRCRSTMLPGRWPLADLLP